MNDNCVVRYNWAEKRYEVDFRKKSDEKAFAHSYKSYCSSMDGLIVSMGIKFSD